MRAMSEIFEVLMQDKIEEVPPKYKLKYDLSLGDIESTSEELKNTEPSDDYDHDHKSFIFYCINAEKNVEGIPVEKGMEEFCVPMIKKEELTEAKLVECIVSSLPQNHCVKSTVENFTSSIDRCFRYIEEHWLVTTNIIFHPKTYAIICEMAFKQNEGDLHEIFEKKALFGTIWTAKIRLSGFCPEDKIVCIGDPGEVGVLPETDDLRGCAILYPNYMSYMEIVEGEPE